MSFEIELDDIGGAVVRRIVVVIDFSLSPPSRLVNTMRLIQDVDAEMSWLPMANE
jgi:hypothetical protein